MPATSKAQQKFMGIVHGLQKGTIKPSDVSGAAKKVAKTMKKKSAKDFAKTKHKGLPNKVRSENMNEDGHTDVASIERKLKLIIQDSVDTIKKLRSMSNEDSLPSWWTDKITLAKDYVSKSRDYIMNPAESVNEISGIDLAKKVVKNKQHEKGMDLFTALYIVQTYDAYKKHPELRKKIEKLSVPKAVKLANLVMKGR